MAPGSLRGWLAFATAAALGRGAAAGPRSSIFVFGEDPVEDQYRYDVHYPLEDIRSRVAAFPGDFEMVAVGSSDWTEDLGEVAFRGPVSAPSWWWGDAAANGSLTDLGQADNPFARAQRSVAFTLVGLGVGDPAAARKFGFWHEAIDVHDWIVKLCNVTLDADYVVVHVQGIFDKVQLHVDQGVRRPQNTSIKYNLNFDGPAVWDFGGVFTRNASLAKHILDPGEPPVHLHGFSQDAGKAGHCDRAHPVRAIATLYPVAAEDVHLLPQPAEARRPAAADRVFV